MIVLRWLKRLVILLLVVVIGLLSPVAYVETMCRPDVKPADYRPILPAEWRRSEASTLLTYPEWHIVHAYDDYAAVIRTGDPADFAFLSSIGYQTDGLYDWRQLYRRITAEGGL
jgi:hypothetical protein